MSRLKGHLGPIRPNGLDDGWSDPWFYLCEACGQLEDAPECIDEADQYMDRIALLNKWQLAMLDRIRDRSQSVPEPCSGIHEELAMVIDSRYTSKYFCLICGREVTPELVASKDYGYIAYKSIWIFPHKLN